MAANTQASCICPKRKLCSMTFWGNCMAYLACCCCYCHTSRTITPPHPCCGCLVLTLLVGNYNEPGATARPDALAAATVIPAAQLHPHPPVPAAFHMLCLQAIMTILGQLPGLTHLLLLPSQQQEAVPAGAPAAAVAAAAGLGMAAAGGLQQQGAGLAVNGRGRDWQLGEAALR
jgi:hypothetical protein